MKYGWFLATKPLGEGGGDHKFHFKNRSDKCLFQAKCYTDAHWGFSISGNSAVISQFHRLLGFRDPVLLSWNVCYCPPHMFAFSYLQILSQSAFDAFNQCAELKLLGRSANLASVGIVVRERGNRTALYVISSTLFFILATDKAFLQKTTRALKHFVRY